MSNGRQAVNVSVFARCRKMCSPCYSRGYNFPVAHCDRGRGADTGDRT
jgi:hypothetical protein